MNAPQPRALAAPGASPIAFAEVLPHGEGWRMALHLHAHIDPAVLARVGPANIVLRPLAPGNSAVRVGAVRRAAGHPNRLHIALHGAPGWYALGLAGLDEFDSAACVTVELAAQAAEVSDPDPPSDPAPGPLTPPVEIDYLAKDYTSFRKLMFEQMKLLAPDWHEGHAADLGVAMVEVMAYAADQLSYMQDGVATEAYLQTARRRSSLLRHSRLLGYPAGQGCAARVWAHVTVRDYKVVLPAGTALLSAIESAPERIDADCSAQAAPDDACANLLRWQIQGCTVFETMHAQQLDQRLNVLTLHAPDQAQFSLAAGATSALLEGRAAAALLQAGDVLQLAQVFVVAGDRLAQAPPGLCHTVRLTGVRAHASGTLTEVRWHDEDALPFALVVAAYGRSDQLHRALAVAHGNIVLADCGLTVRGEALDPVEADLPYRPALRHQQVLHVEPLSAAGAGMLSAAASLRPDPRRATAAVLLHQQDYNDPQHPVRWHATRDLLGADRFVPGFVVESEADGCATLRFGSGNHGRLPQPGDVLRADYRIGAGALGNVGAQTLRHIVSPDGAVGAVRNLSAARGGRDPEPNTSIRINAPDYYLAPQRCISAADYAARARSCAGVADAAAELRWTGSWYTAVVSLVPDPGRSLDAALRADVLDCLNRWRQAGCEVQLRAARVAGLDIALAVQVEPGAAASEVRQALLNALGSGRLDGAAAAFFNPQRFAFGKPLYLSALLAAARAVPGVRGADVLRFQRHGAPARGELAVGMIAAGPDEVLRVDNDARHPERGTLHLLLKESA